MRAALFAYAGALNPFVALDIVRLSNMGTRLYRPALGDLLRAKTDLGPAILFYLIYAGAVVALAILPNTANSARAAGAGAILGLAAYATYNLTNLATLRIYSLPLTVIDIAWGAILTATAAWIGFKAASL